MTARPPAPPLASNRTLVGIGALLCGLLALITYFVLSPSATPAPVTGAAVRVSLVLGSLWLAMPSTGSLLERRTIFAVVVAVLVLLAIWRRPAFYLIPVLIVGVVVAMIIRPKSRRVR